MEMVGALFAGTMAAAEAAGTMTMATLGTATATGVSASLASLGSAGATAASLSALQGVTTAGSALLSLASGAAGIFGAVQQSSMDDIRASQEGLAGQQQALDIKRNLLQRIGAARVGFAASGIDIAAGGQESALEGDLTNEADYQTRIAQGNAALRQGAAQVGSKNALLQGVSTGIKTVGKIASNISDYRLSIAARG